MGVGASLALAAAVMVILGLRRLPDAAGEIGRAGRRDDADMCDTARAPAPATTEPSPA